jgi:hypothetical protein
VSKSDVTPSSLGERGTGQERLSVWLRRQPPFKAGAVVPERIRVMVAQDFNDLREDLNKPNLGLATTRELLDELECRYRVGLTGVPTADEELNAAALRGIVETSTPGQLMCRTAGDD